MRQPRHFVGRTTLLDVFAKPDSAVHVQELLDLSDGRKGMYLELPSRLCKRTHLLTRPLALVETCIGLTIGQIPLYASLNAACHIPIRQSLEA